MNDNIDDKIIGDKIREWEASTSSADNDRLWNRLEQRLEDTPEKKIKPLYYWWAAAAVLLFGLLGGWLARQQPGEQTATATKLPAAQQNIVRTIKDTAGNTITKIHKPEHAKHQRKMVVAKRSSRNAAPSVSVSEITPVNMTAADLTPGFPGMFSSPIITAACYDDIKIQMPLCY